MVTIVNGKTKMIRIVSIGAQTNLALALLKQPSLREEIGAIVFMVVPLGSSRVTAGATLHRLQNVISGLIHKPPISSSNRESA